MEMQIKRAVKAGNSSAIILPRSWLNMEVRVEIVKKNNETILSDALEILKQHIKLSSIMGVYLTGSYAREEERPNSDIDILVITDDIDKEMINEGIYNILVVSKELLKQKLETDLLPIGQMMREAIPLLNSDFLNLIKVEVTKENVKWYIDTTESKLRMIEKIINISKKKNKKYLSDRIAYTLVLRIRTLHIIENLLKNKDYTKKEFVKIIETVSKGKNAYERYLAMKNNMKDENKLTLQEAEALYGYLKNQLDKTKHLLK